MVKRSLVCGFTISKINTLDSNSLHNVYVYTCILN